MSLQMKRDWVISSQFEDQIIKNLKIRAGTGPSHTPTKELRDKLDPENKELIGGNWTYLAFKDHSNYLLATMKKGMKLVKEDKVVYYEPFGDKEAWLLDVEYVDVIDGYILSYNDKLYLKKNDESGLEEWMDIRSGIRVGSSIRYSKLNKRLFLFRDSDEIVMVDPETTSIENFFYAEIEERLFDLQFYGRFEDKIVACSESGKIISCKFEIKKSTNFQIFEHQVNLISGRNECLQSIEVCPKNKYLFCQINMRETPKSKSQNSSRLIIFSIRERNLELLATRDLFKQNFSPFSGSKIFYLGKKLVILTLSFQTESRTDVVTVDIEKQSILVGGYFAKNGESHPIKYYELNGEWYYTGMKGEIKKVIIGIGSS